MTEANVGFVIYSTIVQFIAIPDDLNPDNIKLITCADMDDSFCALSTGELFLNLGKQRDKIDLLVTKLYEIKDLFLEDQKYTGGGTSNTTPVIKTVLDAMATTGGKAILFCTDLPLGGSGALKKLRLDDGKDFKAYKMKVKKREKIRKKFGIFDFLAYFGDKRSPLELHMR